MINPWQLMGEAKICNVPVKVYANADDSSIMFSFHTSIEKSKEIEAVIAENLAYFGIEPDFARDITTRN